MTNPALISPQAFSSTYDRAIHSPIVGIVEDPDAGKGVAKLERHIFGPHAEQLALGLIHQWYLQDAGDRA